MANAYFYSNNAVQTTLSGSISSGSTTVTVGAVTGFPVSFPYVIALDFGAATEELVTVTAAAGLNLTIARGFGGTSAQSHSLGAAVRHVYNAIDATDFRTHEAATASVHGVTGALVGATQSQTLTNKTLTSPTINAGVLSGTFTGSPTFSGTVTSSGTLTSSGATLSGSWAGSPTFTGSPAFSGVVQLNTATSLVQATKTNTTQQVLAALVGGDTFDRYRLYPDGTQEYGSGAAARDLTVTRSSAKVFGVTGTVLAQPTDTALDGLSVNLPTSTAGDLTNLKVNAVVQAAMGNDGAYRVYQNNTPTTFTPVVTGGGTVTWTTRTGWWFRIGKMIYVSMHLVVNAAGSGAANFQVDAPTATVSGATDQILLTHFQSGTTRVGYTDHFMGGTAATFDRIRVQDGGAADTVTNLVGSQLTAGAILVIQGWYREA
jgi:hypothetical protein